MSDPIATYRLVAQLSGGVHLSVVDGPVGRVYVSDENGVLTTAWDTALTDSKTLRAALAAEDIATGAVRMVLTGREFDDRSED